MRVREVGMNSALSLILIPAAIASAWFGPNVRVDRNYQSEYACGYCAIALGPGAPSIPPIYVAFHGESWLDSRTDVWFQKSLDGGRTWLPTDLLIQRGEPWAGEPDIATDSGGNVYVVYLSTDSAGHDQMLCVRSSDGGVTWTSPARVDDDSSNGATIGTTRIAADSAGNLLCVWNGHRTSSLHIWSSVSTDRGATWGRNVQVDDDTTNEGCYHPDACIQPGTSDYLVAATVYRWFDGSPYHRPCAFLYRSTDRGLTFQPGVQLDTFDYYASNPHVAADRDHIICDYLGQGRSGPILAEARTFYTRPDTWGKPSSIINPDSFLVDDMSTPALSADGRVHTALYQGRHVRYTYSLDHGVSWSDPERVNEDTLYTGFPDIGADSDGHAYVVWAQGNSGCFRIWFATNNPLAIAEQPLQQPVGVQPIPTVARNVLFLPEATSPKPRAASLMDVSGRKVLDLKPGPNDISRLSPGVYFIKGQGSRGQGSEGSRVTKVVVTR